MEVLNSYCRDDNWGIIIASSSMSFVLKHLLLPGLLEVVDLFLTLTRKQQ
jgi:hypothetical protein